MKFTTLAVVATSALAASATYSNGTSYVSGGTGTVILTPTPAPTGYYSTGISTGTGSPNPPSNNTSILPTGTKTPVGPSGTSTSTPTPPPGTNGAAVNSAGSALAVVGLAIAYFL